MRVTICGVRGSVPAPGNEFAAVGGNTSSVAIAHSGQPPSLLLDAGTGIRAVTALLGGAPFRGTILLGHLHWDHTIGLPFFAAGDRPDAEVRLFLPEQGCAAEALLSKMMSPPHFPISPGQLNGQWSFAELTEGTHHLEGFTVVALEIPHKGGRTFGFRITDPLGATLAYLSDHGPIALGAGPDGWGDYHPAALALADGADLLIHDAQYSAAELPARAAFGHSTPDYAAALGQRAGVQRVLLYHHDPGRTDAEVAALRDSVAARFPKMIIDIAVERMEITLP